MEVVEQVPQYRLHHLDDGTKEKLQVTVQLPGVSSASELEVNYQQQKLFVRAPGKYRLELPLEAIVNEKPLMLRFVKTKAVLKAEFLVENGTGKGTSSSRMPKSSADKGPSGDKKQVCPGTLPLHASFTEEARKLRDKPTSTRVSTTRLDAVDKQHKGNPTNRVQAGGNTRTIESDAPTRSSLPLAATADCNRSPASQTNGGHLQSAAPCNVTSPPSTTVPDTTHQHTTRVANSLHRKNTSSTTGQPSSPSVSLTADEYGTTTNSTSGPHASTQQTGTPSVSPLDGGDFVFQAQGARGASSTNGLKRGFLNSGKTTRQSSGTSFRSFRSKGDVKMDQVTRDSMEAASSYASTQTAGQVPLQEAGACKQQGSTSTGPVEANAPCLQQPGVMSSSRTAGTAPQGSALPRGAACTPDVPHHAKSDGNVHGERLASNASPGVSIGVKRGASTVGVSPGTHGSSPVNSTAAAQPPPVDHEQVAAAQAMLYEEAKARANLEAAQEFASIGEAALQAGEYSRAVRLLRKAVALSPFRYENLLRKAESEAAREQVQAVAARQAEEAAQKLRQQFEQQFNQHEQQSYSAEHGDGNSSGQGGSSCPETPSAEEGGAYAGGEYGDWYGAADGSQGADYAEDEEEEPQARPSTARSLFSVGVLVCKLVAALGLMALHWLWTDMTWQLAVYLARQGNLWLLHKMTRTQYGGVLARVCAMVVVVVACSVVWSLRWWMWWVWCLAIWQPTWWSALGLTVTAVMNSEAVRLLHVVWYYPIIWWAVGGRWAALLGAPLMLAAAVFTKPALPAAASYVAAWYAVRTFNWWQCVLALMFIVVMYFVLMATSMAGFAQQHGSSSSSRSKGRWGVGGGDIPPGVEGEVARVLAASDFYEVLEVDRSADDEQLRKAKKSKVLLTHPDKIGGVPGAAAAFQQVTEAYDVLSDPAQRREYDNSLRQPESTPWEEDVKGWSEGNHATTSRGLSIACRGCCGSHTAMKVDINTAAARWCEECQVWHAAKDGEGWVHTTGPFWRRVTRVYVCCNGSVYDATSWAECSGMLYDTSGRAVPANKHAVWLKFGSGKQPGFGDAKGRGSDKPASSGAGAAGRRGGARKKKGRRR